MVAVNLGTSVLADVDAETAEAPVAAAILQGQDVYEDVTDGKLKLLSTAIAPANIKRAGVALNSAPTVGAPCKYQYGGKVKGTATLVVGTAYYASDTPGSVAPEADLGTGDNVHFMGVADTTTSLKLHQFISGVAKA